MQNLRSSDQCLLILSCWREVKCSVNKILKEEVDARDVAVPQFVLQMLSVNGVAEVSGFSWSRKKNSHQDTSGAGAEYEQFLARTKTLQQAPSSWSVAGLEKALNNIGCLNPVCHICNFLCLLFAYSGMPELCAFKGRFASTHCDWTSSSLTAPFRCSRPGSRGR